MTLPASGAISLSQVNTELGYGASATISMNDAAVRTLFGAGGSGTSISMSQGYGKANQFSFTISANQVNANLRTLAVNAGWNGTSKVIATVNSGVYIYSSSTGTPALTINGSFPNGVQLNNNGTIQGMGGAGGRGGFWNGNMNPPIAGGGGGLALSVSVGVSINNAGRIAGGGGGASGAGFVSRYYSKQQSTQLAGSGGGGGLGGGAGGAAYTSYAFTSNAGQAGTLTSAGAGGAAKIDTINSGQYNIAGGNGGSYGAAGSTSGGGDQAPVSGGAAGAAVAGNGNISWIAVGTRNGGIS